VTRFIAKTGLTLADGTRLEPGDKVDEKALGKSVKWLADRGHIEDASKAKPGDEKPKEGKK
jgi:hypothetical protein